MASLAEAVAGRGIARAMAGHSPLSARLAEEAGFNAIWASGFELSALYGVPDAGVVGMELHLAMARAMAAAVTIPVVADIDTGFGNAVNVIHAVRAYEQAGVAAVVIEDQVFPKMSSLAPGGGQLLAPVATVQGKLEAALAARRSPDFLVIGRTEALICGLGQEEALARAAAYDEAGCDMILVHSKANTPDEIESFAAAWRGRARLVVVPTAYPSLTMERAERAGNIGMIIYGNHAVRACAAAMRSAFAAIIRDGDSRGVEDVIAPVSEIFRLQGMDALRAQEARFLR